MQSKYTYQVGGNYYALEYSNGMLSEKDLLPYAPFRTESSYDDDKLFTLSIIDDPEALATKGRITADLVDENGKTTIFTHEDGCLTIYLTAITGCQCCRIHLSKDYRAAKAWIGGMPNERRYAIDTALMLLYTFASSMHDTLLVHASTVEYEGKGYLFLGKSGTGKSTHSHLWIENIPGTELLNDDNPIIRIIDGKAYVYGSPWSGKTNCYRNHRIPIGGLVRLHQAPFNRITPLAGMKAYAALLPSCSCMKWDHDMAEAIHSTISKVISRIPIYALDCLPNSEAAILCKEELTTNLMVGTHGSCVRKS
ncbi:MAG: hypothetical protein K2K75_14095 [Muribaculaceae bacterium]|nr:hypothetical protein [Muribaculaceae bacterium]